MFLPVDDLRLVMFSVLYDLARCTNARVSFPHCCIRSIMNSAVIAGVDSGVEDCTGEVLLYISATVALRCAKVFRFFRETSIKLVLLPTNVSERQCVELSADRSSVLESMAWFFNCIVNCCDMLQI